MTVLYDTFDIIKPKVLYHIVIIYDTGTKYKCDIYLTEIALTYSSSNFWVYNDVVIKSVGVAWDIVKRLSFQNIVKSQAK